MESVQQVGPACRKCGQPKGRRTRQGWWRCRPCDNAHARHWREQNPDKSRAISRKHHASHRDRRRQQAAEYRAAHLETERARHRAVKRRSREEHPGLLREQYKAWRHRFPEKQIWHQARKRAAVKGFTFDITPEDIVIPKRCPILGIPLVLPRERAEAATGFIDESPSLDRIDNEKGYVRGNVWVISWRANRIKGYATLKELEAVVRALRRKLIPRRLRRTAPPQIQLPLALPKRPGRGRGHIDS